MKKIGYIALAHTAYLSLLLPLIINGTAFFFLYFPAQMQTMQFAFVTANVASVLLQWLLWVGEVLPTSSLTLLLHNGVVFTRRLFIAVGIAWIGLLAFTAGFIATKSLYVLFLLFILWYIGGIAIFIHTALTKKIYALPKDIQSKIVNNTGIFWPYIFMYIVIGLTILLSFSIVRQTIVYSYQYTIKGEIPVETVSHYINENTVCDSFEKNTPNYSTCKIYQYSLEGIYSPNPLDCSDMYVNDKDCFRLQAIQSAITKQDSGMCDSLQSTRQFPLCIGQFPHSVVWQNGCAAIMDKVMHGKSNLAQQLINGRCLTEENANLSLPRYMFKPYEPAWFTEHGDVDERTLQYLISINADPNNVDEFGQTILIVFIKNLVSSIDHTINSLPARQQSEVVEKELEPLKRLMKFGVNPQKKDLKGKNAFDFAQDISNLTLQTRVIGIMTQ